MKNKNKITLDDGTEVIVDDDLKEISVPQSYVEKNGSKFPFCIQYLIDTENYKVQLNIL